MDPTDERTPLIAHDYESDNGANISDIQRYALPQDAFSTTQRVSILALLSLVLITVDFGSYITATGMADIKPEIICHQLESKNDGNKRCDFVAMPREYVVVQNWETAIRLICGILTAIPYGFAADKFSRRNWLALCLGGILLSMAGDIIICLFPDVFPVRLLWLSKFCLLIGGGPFLVSALAFAVANDVSSQAQRTYVFLVLGSVSKVGLILATVFIGNVIPSAKGPWTAVYFGLAITCLSTTLALFIPSTLDASSERRVSHQEADESATVERATKIRMYINRAMKGLTFVTRWVARDNKRLGLLLMAALPVCIGILPQPMYFLNWSKPLLITVSSLLWTCVILPGAAYVFISIFHLTLVKSNLWLLRSITLLLLVGALTVGFTHSSRYGHVHIAIPEYLGTILVAIGDGYLLVTRSLLTMVGEGHDIAVLYSLVAMIQGLSVLIGWPLLSWLNMVESGNVNFTVTLLVVAGLVGVGGAVGLFVKETESSVTEYDERV